MPLPGDTAPTEISAFWFLSRAVNVTLYDTVGPRKELPVWMVKLVGPEADVAPARAIDIAGPKLAEAGVVVPGDAAAAGAAMAVAITGSDQATPAVTRRRLIPPFSS